MCIVHYPLGSFFSFASFNFSFFLLLFAYFFFSFHLGLASITQSSLVNEDIESKSIAGPKSASSEEAIEAFRKLDRYKICRACNGVGVVQYKYNYMMLEKTCEVCDGDVIMDSEPPVVALSPATSDGTGTDTEIDLNVLISTSSELI